MDSQTSKKEKQTRPADYTQLPSIQNQVQHDDSQVTEIDLVEVFYLFMGHIWQIILCMILGAAIAFGFTYYFITPKYQATSKVYVVSASKDSIINLSDLQLGSSMLGDYKELMLSRPTLEGVIDSLKLDILPNKLSDLISISNASDTRILNIRVTTTDPVMSANIANEMVNQASIYLPQIMGNEPPNLIQSAEVPLTKSSPSYSRNTVMGALLGALLIMAILLIRYLMNDTFMSPDDVEKYLGIQPLASIPEGDLGSFNRKKRNKKADRED